MFEIDVRRDGETGKTLRDWVETAVIDIVGFYSINPDTLYGSIQEGPMIHGYRREDSEKVGRDNAHFRGYYGIDKMGPEKIEQFTDIYKAFAISLYNVMNGALSDVIDSAIEQGYGDVACTIMQYRLGFLVVNVSADSPHKPSSVLDLPNPSSSF